MTEDQEERLICALERLIWGGSLSESPTGFEALGMALSGRSPTVAGHVSVSDGLVRIAEAIDSHAEAIKELADALARPSKKG